MRERRDDALLIMGYLLLLICFLLEVELAFL